MDNTYPLIFKVNLHILHSAYIRILPIQNLKFVERPLSSKIFN